MSATQTATDLARVGEEVARLLGSARMFDGRVLIRTPILFPSGSTATVAVEDLGRGGYLVSDLGQGYDEAHSAGLERGYSRIAEEVARLAGVQVRGHAFTVSGLSRDQLVGAAMTIANCAGRSVERLFYRAADRPSGAAVDKLVRRLERLFMAERVRCGAAVLGASTHAWPVDAAVTSEKGEVEAVFDLVTPHPISVVFATTKFHDLARLRPSPARVAVVSRKAQMGDLLMVVSQAAKVIEEDAPDPTYREAAFAA